MSHNWPLTGQGQQRPPKLKGRFRKAKPSQRTRNLTKFLQRYYPAKNERERKKKYRRAPPPWALQVRPARPLAARRRGAEMRARRSRRCATRMRSARRRFTAGAAGPPHAGPAAGGSGGSWPGRRVRPGTPRAGRAAPSPSAFPEPADTDGCQGCKLGAARQRVRAGGSCLKSRFFCQKELRADRDRTKAVCSRTSLVSHRLAYREYATAEWRH